MSQLLNISHVRLCYRLAGVAGLAVSFRNSLYQLTEEPLVPDHTISEQLESSNRVKAFWFCKR